MVKSPMAKSFMVVSFILPDKPFQGPAASYPSTAVFACAHVHTYVMSAKIPLTSKLGATIVVCADKAVDWIVVWRLLARGRPSGIFD